MIDSTGHEVHWNPGEPDGLEEDDWCEECGLPLDQGDCTGCLICDAAREALDRLVEHEDYE
jgi:hypothetical protein